MKTQTKETSHSEQQAASQCESILEMVRALDKRTAAEDWARDKTLDECIGDMGDACEDTTGKSLDDLRDELVELITAGDIEPEGFEFDEEAARERIQQDPIEIQVRSNWENMGAELTPAEFCILLCTGGPAVRIIGELASGEPSRPRIEHQDWGTPWTEYFPTEEQLKALETYCAQFYFGE